MLRRFNPWRLLATALTVELVGSAIAWRRDAQRAAALAARLRTPRALLSASPRVSILVAAWNEAPTIRQHIRSVLALTYLNREYVVVAGGDDGTYDLARDIAGAGVTLLEQHVGEGKQASLGRALEHATGEVVFLTDADCLLDDDSFERTLAPLVNEEEPASTGGYAPLPEQQELPFVQHQWAVHTYTTSGFGRHVPGVVGRNAAIRTEILRACGAFAQPSPVGTDYHLAQRILAAGYRIRYVPESRVLTAFEERIGPYLRQQSRWLKNIVVHGVRFGAWGQVAAVLRSYAVGLAAVLLPAAAPLFGSAALVPWLLGVTHTVASRIRYLDFARRGLGMTMSLRTLVASAVYGPLDLLALAFGAIELARPGRRWRW